MTRRKTRVLSLLSAAAALLLAACAPAEPKQLASGDLTAAGAKQVCSILAEAGLQNTDTLAEWIRITEKGDPEDGAGFSDANCRLTVLLLAGDLVRYDSLEEAYSGDYLMFDLEAIGSQEAFRALRGRELLLATLFGEMPVPETGFADALAERWAKHGIRFESGTCSIISILFQTYDQEEAFVGHTGILVDCRDIRSCGSDYLFIEKIAFGEPFRITLLRDEEELIRMLSLREDYSVEPGEPAPAVYRNGERIGELAPAGTAGGG